MGRRRSPAPAARTRAGDAADLRSCGQASVHRLAGQRLGERQPAATRGNEFYTHPGAPGRPPTTSTTAVSAMILRSAASSRCRTRGAWRPAMYAPLLGFAVPGGQIDGASELANPSPKRPDRSVSRPGCCAVRPYQGERERISVALNSGSDRHVGARPQGLDLACGSPGRPGFRYRRRRRRAYGYPPAACTSTPPLGPSRHQGRARGGAQEARSRGGSCRGWAFRIQRQARSAVPRISGRPRLVTGFSMRKRLPVMVWPARDPFGIRGPARASPVTRTASAFDRLLDLVGTWAAPAAPGLSRGHGRPPGKHGHRRQAGHAHGQSARRGLAEPAASRRAAAVRRSGGRSGALQRPADRSRKPTGCAVPPRRPCAPAPGSIAGETRPRSGPAA